MCICLVDSLFAISFISFCRMKQKKMRKRNFVIKMKVEQTQCLGVWRIVRMCWRNERKIERDREKERERVCPMESILLKYISVFRPSMFLQLNKTRCDSLINREFVFFFFISFRSHSTHSRFPFQWTRNKWEKKTQSIKTILSISLELWTQLMTERTDMNRCRNYNFFFACFFSATFYSDEKIRFSCNS